MSPRSATRPWAKRSLKSLDPTHQLVSIVHQELVALMGPVDHSLHLKPDMTILMLCGLQGSGKTTTCGKLGRMFLEHGRKPMLVAADLQRPAAIQQLQVLGEQIGIPVYADLAAKDPGGPLPDRGSRGQIAGRASGDPRYGRTIARR